MSLETILRESLEGALIDGRCRLFSSAGIPCAPGGFGGGGSSGGSGRSPLSPLAMQYISGINENLGVGSPSAQPSSSYVPELSSSLLEHIKSLSVPSPVVMHGYQGNGSMFEDIGKMFGSVGIPSPSVAPLSGIYGGYDPVPKEQYGVSSPALVPPSMARGTYGVASPVGLYRHEEITSPIFPEPFVPPVKLCGFNEEVPNFNGSMVGLIVPPKFQVPDFKTHDALEGIKRRVDILDQYGRSSNEPSRIGSRSEFYQEPNPQAKKYNSYEESCFGHICRPLNLSREVPELDNQKYKLQERFDYSGHREGRKGPHFGYDLKVDNESISKPRPLGEFRDSTSLGSQEDYGYKIHGKKCIDDEGILFLSEKTFKRIK